MEKPSSAAPSPPSTTIVQADAATFKELVQRLTGYHQPQPRRSPPNSPAVGAAARLSGVKRLHERPRGGGSRLKLVVHEPAAAGAVAPKPARLDVLEEEEVEGGGEGVIVVNEEEEEQAIKERRFYLHPSPPSRRRRPQPDLLPLFPLTSQKAGEH